MTPRDVSTRVDHGPVDRYLSPAAFREASEILSALADVLARRDGVWAEDARHDAEQIQVLADTLRDWCPEVHRGAPGAPEDPAREPALGHGAAWPHVLALYLE